MGEVQNLAVEINGKYVYSNFAKSMYTCLFIIKLHLERRWGIGVTVGSNSKSVLLMHAISFERLSQSKFMMDSTKIVEALITKAKVDHVITSNLPKEKHQNIVFKYTFL